LSGVTFALLEWPTKSRHGALVIIGLFGCLALGALGLVEQRAKSPMIPFSLFRSREFTGANLLTFFIYAPLGAFLFFTPLDLIQIQHYSATRAGAAFSPFVVIMLFLSRWAGRLVERYGARLPLTLGPFVTVAGYAFFATASQDGDYWTSFLPGVLMISVGMTVTVAPLSTTVMNAAPQSHAGVASGINNGVSRLASLVAIALFGALLVFTFSRTLDHHLAMLDLPAEEVSHIQANRLQLAAIASPDPRGERAIAASFVQSYRVVLWVAAGSAFLGAATGWLFTGRSRFPEPSRQEDYS
jgi:MFS family permease